MSGKEFTCGSGASKGERSESSGELQGERCTEAFRQRTSILAALRPRRPDGAAGVTSCCPRRVQRRRVERSGTAQRTGGLRGGVAQRKDCAARTEGVVSLLTLLYTHSTLHDTDVKECEKDGVTECRDDMNMIA